MKAYKSIVNGKTIVVLNHELKKGTENKTVDSLHHIHLLDRSGSMSYHIDGLVEDVKKTLTMINDDDYISIIWFSGAGQYKTLVKGARKTDKLNDLLDGIKSTVGCTCFSDPLREVGEIVKDLKTICPNFSVTLFTDGEPVTPWSESEEEDRVVKVINEWKDEVLALNTVGYGNYYNEDLLKKMSEMTSFGQLIHSSKISEYSEIFSYNFEKIKEMVVDSIEIKTGADDVFYISSRMVKPLEKEFKLKAVEKKKNQFVLVGNTDFDFIYNGEKFNSKDIKDKIPSNSLVPVLYGYASSSYYKGNREVSIGILSILRDKALIDSHLKSFTVDELSNHQKALNKAVFHKNGRLLDGECEENYIPADDCFCVMDALYLLTEMNNVGYVYASEYKRIGLKTTDSFNLFERNKNDLNVTPLKDLVFNKSKLNVSIRSILKGKVRLNPKQAEKVGLPNEVESFKHKTQSLIKDGFLNMETIKLVLGEEELEEVRSWVNKDKNFKYTELEDIEGGKLVEIHLNSLPVINKMYVGKAGDLDYIANSTLEILKLEAEQKMFNYLFKDYEESGYISEYVAMAKYDDAQRQVLFEHGLAKDMSYLGINNVKEEKNEDDFYYSREILFNIAGMASLPSGADVLAKYEAEKKLNEAGNFMLNAYLNMNKELYGSAVSNKDKDKETKYLEEKIKETKSKISFIRKEMFCVKMSKVLTGGWFTGLNVDKKGNFIYPFGDKELVIKASKVKTYF